MAADGTIALSALVLGIALSGIVAGSTARKRQNGHWWMLITFALLGMIASTPLSGAFARPAYLFQMPAILPCILLLPVAIHAYIRMQAASSHSLSSHHFILPAAGLVIMLGFWFLPTDTQSVLFVEGRLPPGRWLATLTLTSFVLIILWCLVSFAYLVSAVRALRRHRARLKIFYSNTDRRELRWIDGLLCLLIILWISAAIALLSDNLSPKAIISGDITLILTALTLLTFMGYAISPHPDGLTAEIMSEAPGFDEPSIQAAPAKYSRSALSDAQAHRIASRIEAAMKQDQLYLDPNLSLRKLSSRVQSPQNLVSQTLNTRLETTFFDYVARWRIEAAKPMIEEGKLSIHDITLQVGFNTRSTFYKAFKNEMGMTPTAYRRAMTGPPTP